MNYLFFDTESANQFNGVAKMCSFGYVLTDDNFNVLEQDDILMNPESAFDWYVVKNIIAYKPEVYKSHEVFPIYYKKIYNLLSNNLVIGFSTLDDIKVIRDACKRYRLNKPKMRFYDAQVMYGGYIDELVSPSLGNVAEALGVERQAERHTSIQDARITMEIVKKLSELTKLPLKKVLELKCNKLSKKKQAEINAIHGRNNFVFNYAIEYLKPEPGYQKTLLGKCFCMSYNYEERHFKEMLLILQEIINRGGTLTRKIGEASTYVKFEAVRADGTPRQCKRELAINELPSKDKIEIISLEELMSLIEYDEKKVEDNQSKIMEDFNEYDKDYVKPKKR